VSKLVHGFDRPWWFAGGQAIDAFLGYESRPHGDIDIACLRRYQLDMQRQLSTGLELWCGDPPGSLRPWQHGEWLAEPIHDIWCRQSTDKPWCLQLMLDEADGDDWVYRRTPTIRLPLKQLVTMRSGLPYLAVEVQLLHKVGLPGSIMPAKNQQDFEACLPMLDSHQHEWLASALQAAHPEPAWLDRFRFGKDPRKRLTYRCAQVFYMRTQSDALICGGNFTRQRNRIGLLTYSSRRMIRRTALAALPVVLQDNCRSLKNGATRAANLLDAAGYA
jgi:hypothetical protein